jgi:AraC-like DNA-binding protein
MRPAALYVSPFHLARRFRAYTGLSLHQYRMRARLSAAFERVVESDDEKSRIGLDVGFSTPSHFTAAFRRRFGVTPRYARATYGRTGRVSGRVAHEVARRRRAQATL